MDVEAGSVSPSPARPDFHLVFRLKLMDHSGGSVVRSLPATAAGPAKSGGPPRRE